MRKRFEHPVVGTSLPMACGNIPLYFAFLKNVIGQNGSHTLNGELVQKTFTDLFLEYILNGQRLFQG